MRTRPAMKKPSVKSAKTRPNWFSSVSENAWAGAGTTPAIAPVISAAEAWLLPRRSEVASAVWAPGADRKVVIDRNKNRATPTSTRQAGAWLREAGAAAMVLELLLLTVWTARLEL